jgi:glycerate kinase
MKTRVVVAPAAFKGSIGPREVCEALAVGVRHALPDVAVLTCPIADGGDGLLDALLPAAALREAVTVTGPLGRPVQATLGWLDDRTAIFESASACGLRLIPPHALDPLNATSRGVGELIAEASQRGADTVIVGLGGSATTDGGTGAARGLGWTFHDATGADLPEGGGALTQLEDFSGGWGLGTHVTALADVQTPLRGPAGAAPTFAPQKGATPAQVETLSAGLDRLAAVFALHGRPDLATLPMGGAAGGLGAGLIHFARATLVGGSDWVLDRVGFDAALAGADWLLTAEGAFDATSLAGKAVGAVIRRAQAARCRVTVVAGSARDVPSGVHAVDGGGRMLAPEDLTALAVRAAREAFGLPAP